MEKTWGNTGTLWSQADWTWAELQLVQEVIQQTHVAGGFFFNTPLFKDKEKQKRFIKLIVKVKNKHFEKQITEEDIKSITIQDVELVIKNVSGISLSIKT